MKKMIIALLCMGGMTVLAADTKTSAPSATKTWTDAPISCQHCCVKVKGNPDAHERSCMMSCSDSGYGLFTTDGKFLTFDKAGNAKALEALEKSDKKDHIRATVTGTQEGDTIKVASLTLI